MVTRGRASSARLRAMLDSDGLESLFYGYPEPSFAFDSNGVFLDGNDALFKRTGFTRSEMAKVSFIGLTPKEDAEYGLEQFNAVLAGEVRRFAITQVDKKGNRLRSGVLLMPLKQNGEVTAVVGFGRDISDLDATHDARERDSLLLTMAGKVARFGAWTIEVPSGDLYWSDELCEIHGYPPGHTPKFDEAFALNSVEDQERVDNALKECKVNGVPFDIERDSHDVAGNRLRMRTIGEAVRNQRGQIVRVQGASWDITEQRAAEHQRRLVEERLSSMMGAISDGMLLLSKDFDFEFVNPRAEKILKKSADELIGGNMWDIFPEGRGTEFAIGYRRALAEQVTVTTRDFYPPLKLWLEVTAYPVDTGLAVYFKDVTDGEEARLALVEGEKKLRSQAALLDVARDAIMVRDLNNEVRFWNKAAEEMYGWTAEEILGRPVRELLYKDPVDFDTATATTIREGFWVGEIEQSAKDGRRILADCSWTLVLDANGAPESIFAVNTDITERRKIEEGYLRTQRIESLGTLAGGVAHDLNNVLTPILMTVQMLERDENDTDKREMLRIVESSVKRGADMIRQVLTFARGVEGRRVEVNIARTVHDAISITRDAIPRNITVSQSVALDLWPTIGDPTQMLQVLINLINNAKDAMPDGGLISLTARNVELKDSYSSVTHLAAPGKYLLVEVEDNGSGMPQEVLNKIFEPFFTTKAQGEGTGLGLATSIAIVRSHGGHMQAYSEIGNGSKFQVHLPAFTGEHGSVVEEIDDMTFERLPRGNGQLVLIVDDEAAIRQITRQALEAFGYRTALASNGAEALDYIASVDGKIDLLFTDMMMPVMDGATTVREITRTMPNLPILAASGLNADGGVARAGLSGVTNFLSKPFTTSELLHAVQDTLRGKKGG